MKIHPGTSSVIPHLDYGPSNQKVKTDDGFDIRNPITDDTDKHGGTTDGSVSSVVGLKGQDFSDLLSSEEKDMLSRLFPSSTLTQGIRAYKTNHKESIRGPRLGGTIDVRQ